MKIRYTIYEPAFKMRVVFLSLVYILLAFSPNNCQIYNGKPHIIGTVGQALNQIVSLNYIGRDDGTQQVQLFLQNILNLISHVTATGPIPTVLAQINHWYDKLVAYVQSVTDKVWTITGTILQSIHYQVVQLTHNFSFDLNKLISSKMLSLKNEIVNDRSQSSRKVKSIMATLNHEALRLHQDALKDYGGHLAEYNNILRALLINVYRGLKKEFAFREESLKNVTFLYVNRIYETVEQLIVNGPV